VAKYIESKRAAFGFHLCNNTSLIQNSICKSDNKKGRAEDSKKLVPPQKQNKLAQSVKNQLSLNSGN
jgi:hypothetical protein